MSVLQSLREARAIVRWMLVGFLLSIGVAVAAPALNPQALTLVCSAAGNVKLVGDTPDGGAPNGSMVHGLDCVLCLPAGAPPAVEQDMLPRMEARHAQPQAPLAVSAWRWTDAASARAPPRSL